MKVKKPHPSGQANRFHYVDAQEDVAAPARALPLPLCVLRGRPNQAPNGKSPLGDWVTCESAHKPLGEVVCSCNGCGQSCRDYLIHEPDRVRKINGLPPTNPGERVFNGSLTRFNGQLILAYRSGWYFPERKEFSSIRFALLNDDLTVKGTVPYNPGLPGVTHGAEDPRLFVANGRLGMIYSGMSVVAGKLNVTPCISIPGMDATHAFPLSEWLLRTIDGKPTRAVEKNWMPYDNGDGLRMIYSSFPDTRIVEFQPDGCVTKVKAPARARNSHPMRQWEIRGGAAPVSVGDGLWWHWLHGWRKDKEHYTYCVGVYEFNRAGEILRMTPGSVWGADAARDGDNVTPDKSVIYPCSAFIENGTWFVTAGHQDCEILVGEFRHDDISSLMVDLK